jgi:hypothetical protein
MKILKQLELRLKKWPMEKNKTWKRETAFLMLLGLAYVVSTGDVSMVEVLVWPIFSFAGLAFGLDVYAKSDGMRHVPPFTSRRGRDERSSEYPVREAEQPDHWHVDRTGVWRDKGSGGEGN